MAWNNELHKLSLRMDLLEAANDTACHHSGGGNSGPTYVGFICAGVAVVFFGSNFVPVKKFETGDGKIIPTNFKS